MTPYKCGRARIISRRIRWRAAYHAKRRLWWTEVYFGKLLPDAKQWFCDWMNAPRFKNYE